MPDKETICLDFDNTVYSYTSGWNGTTETPDLPTKGAREAIAQLRKTYRVVINSARCNQPEGKTAIESWLKKHNIEVDEVVSAKPGAVLYVDDRGFRFDGSWENVLHFIADPKKLQPSSAQPETAQTESRTYLFRRSLIPMRQA